MIQRPRLFPDIGTVRVARCLAAHLSTICLAALAIVPGLASQQDGRIEEVCIVSDPQLTEVSGIAVSREHPDAIWMHNDSGDSARLFLVGLDGQTRAVTALKGITALDWEDICSFRCDETNWLLVADIGDNLSRRTAAASPCQLHLVREPVVKDQTPQMELEVHSTLTFEFPDGPRDCEGVGVDPIQKEILLVSKTDPRKCRLYRMPLNLEPGQHRLTATDVCSIPVPYATAMDVSADGRQIAVASMLFGVHLRRDDSQSWTDAAQSSLTVLTLPPRRQGESVCFDAEGKCILLNSEGVAQPLWRQALRPE